MRNSRFLGKYQLQQVFRASTSASRTFLIFETRIVSEKNQVLIRRRFLRRYHCDHPYTPLTRKKENPPRKIISDTFADWTEFSVTYQTSKQQLNEQNCETIIIRTSFTITALTLYKSHSKKRCLTLLSEYHTDNGVKHISLWSLHNEKRASEEEEKWSRKERERWLYENFMNDRELVVPCTSSLG